jgi:hypothetical protein
MQSGDDRMTPEVNGFPRADVPKSLRAVIVACVVPACLTLFGCTVQTGLPGPNVIFDTPMGPVPLNSPAPGPPGGSLAVPPGLDQTVPAPVPAVSRDGTYSGRAEVLSTGGSVCLNGMNVSNFKVRRNSVRFGQFRGTIAPDGGLQMVFRGTWIIGQFEGTTFRGQVDGRGNWDSPGCTFILTLDRVGP